MNIIILSIFILLAFTVNAQTNNQPSEAEAVNAIYHNDSLFWQAYNKCDVKTMMTFLTDDVEFYHDKGGPTFTKAKLEESIVKGLCGNPGFHLRREAVSGSVKAFPLKDYGGLISGEHVFYATEGDKPEYLDGSGKFTQLWQYRDGKWKMSRVLSYDHGPAAEKLTKNPR